MSFDTSNLLIIVKMVTMDLKGIATFRQKNYINDFVKSIDIRSKTNFIYDRIG